MPARMGSPRATALALAVPALLLAGCMATVTDGTTGQPPPPPPPPFKLDCSTSHWNQTCVALASPNDSPSKAEVDIAVNPKDAKNVFVASKDLDRKASDCVWAVGQATFDGGATWQTTYVGDTLANRTPGQPLYGWHCITDPILQFEPDGTLHYSLQAYRFNPAGLPYVNDPTGTVGLPPEMGNMYHAVSHDGGKTFSDIFPMHVGDETVIFHDYMRMGVNPKTSTVFTIWNQLTGGAASEPVLVAVEKGATRARPPVYFPQTISPTGLGESSVVGASDGTVYAWLSGFNSGGNAVLATSIDDGLTFSTPQKVWSFTPMGELQGAQFRTGTSVELAVDNTDGQNKGCLYAVWGGKETGTVGPSDIYVRVSCNQGGVWTEPILVNREHREDGQWMPRVSVDGGGHVHVVYYTRAYDPAGHLVDAEHAYSMDGGHNWTTQRLTSVSFDGDKGIHQDGFPFIGDYIGIASAGNDTYMGFPVTQTGRAEIGVAHTVFQG